MSKKKKKVSLDKMSSITDGMDDISFHVTQDVIDLNRGRCTCRLSPAI